MNKVPSISTQTAAEVEYLLFLKGRLASELAKSRKPRFVQATDQDFKGVEKPGLAKFVISDGVAYVVNSPCKMNLFINRCATCGLGWIKEASDRGAAPQ
mmetsp:Transcript_118789/g.236630  ORF Transcript_118789/g.236630 Transcript_118789/m.236630 type:complete len:99 (+) Transcript_118789:109-405(+)